LLAKVGCLVWIIAATSTPARASLSGPPTSIEEDRAALHATLREEVQSAYTIEHVALPNGVEVREFLSRGRVFGVAWSGPFKPDLQQILGSHFTTFVFEASRTSLAGHSQLHAERSDVVIDASGHSRFFAGRAFVPALVPKGIDVRTVVH